MRRRAAVAVILLALACREQPDTRPAELRRQLTEMRNAIKSFHRDNGRYPHSLEELVPKYLRRIPADPLTLSPDTWRLTTEQIVPPNADFTTAAARTQTFVIDVQSGAGEPYSSY